MANTKPLTTEQRRMIHSTVGAALTTKDGKTYEYRDGYSDEMIAKRASVATQQVTSIRIQWFGPLKRGRWEGIKYGELVDLVNKLSNRLAEVEARMAAMTPKSSMATNIPINNGVNGSATLR